MENWHLQFSKCRNVTTHNCPHINVLRVEMEPMMGDRETEPTENLENWTNGKFTSQVFQVSMKWNISINHYEKIEKWLPFCTYQSYEKISNYQPPPPPKFGSLVFQVSTETEYTINHNEKIEKWPQFYKYWSYGNIPSYQPPQVWVSRNRISALVIMKNGCHFIKIDHMEKFQINDPSPKFESLVFPVSMEMEYQCWPLWKNWKMAAIS